MATPELAALTSDDLVTGDAVALDLPPAGPGPRVAATLLDMLVAGLLLIALVMLMTAATVATDAALAEAGAILTVVAVLIAFPTTIETLTRGRSLGKLALGLRVVRDDAGPITFQHAFVRSLVGVVEIWAFAGGPALISAMVSQRGKRLGDHAAGTYVVRDRVDLRLGPPVPMPPPLGAWARSADVAGLPTGLALAVRQFLARRDTLDAAARDRVGGELADQVAAYVAPAPPPGTPADAFLAAVVATRRERDLARLAREDSLRRRLGARR